MKQTIAFCALFILTAVATTACKKIRGCTDLSATNYNSEANIDCCCQYGKVVFYSRYPAYNVGGVLYSITAYPIKVFVNNQEIGTIEAFYPNGPGTSTVPGVLVFDPGSDKKIEWYAKVTAPNGAFIILGSGTINAGRLNIAVPIF